MNVNYIAPVFDSSGYSEAARNNIISLHRAGLTVDVNPISFESYKIDLGGQTGLIKELLNKDLDSKVKIIHCTPEHYPQLVDSDMYNIGFAAWETSKLPEHWVSKINALDEVWVPSQYNVEVFKSSGITIPVTVIPHALDTEPREIISADLIQRSDPDEIVFYSIFQWLDRKNPVGLLKAYFTEFKAYEKVTLVLKTFIANQDGRDREKLKLLIGDMKRALHLDSYPSVILISNLLTAEQMDSLHEECDVFVFPTKGEGFGLPVAEAMLAGNPVITTNYSGCSEFVQDCETGYLIDYQETPVFGMPWPIYTGNMTWADPNLMHLRARMRMCYADPENHKQMGLVGQQYIRENLSYEVIGSLMKKRLEEICSQV